MSTILSQVNVRPARWDGMWQHCLPEDVGSMGMTLHIYILDGSAIDGGKLE